MPPICPLNPCTNAPEFALASEFSDRVSEIGIHIDRAIELNNLLAAPGSVVTISDDELGRLLESGLAILNFVQREQANAK